MSAIALVVIGVGGTVAASNPATLYACYDVFGGDRNGDVERETGLELATSSLEGRDA